ncbi:DUF4383 domain-containing protein [Solirubrobacter sp. CPCC 204708]|uniref:DUF4383 domain-containing protein n=1 Tax=Solirubrobacter deserti TaxID=2282478 RepID=A0ABT4RFX0_9ACTN|nr:DUF4383 domain-containing protein [Solirubrobacter deserti]MBE2318180.1 DUF4383 domain-containing protein [Solirubrobacter deserti]MDA0137461.1 DUF4383 domain-containing protein [Solirubrobacter deserti]
MSHMHGPATDFDRARTPAQWYCLLAGAALALAGLAGFIADASFEFGDGIDGGSLLGFEVNGVHNLIHLASGALLLVASPRRDTAKAVAIAFGATYALVAVIGLIDGDDVLGLIPINSADNVLHVGLALVGLVAGLVSRSASRRDSDTLVDRTSPTA